MNLPQRLVETRLLLAGLEPAESLLKVKTDFYLFLAHLEESQISLLAEGREGSTDFV